MERKFDEGSYGIGNVDEDIQCEPCEVSEEAMKIRKLVDPKRPSQQEVDEHYLSHLPFRNWCPHCMRGKAKELDCRKSDGASGDMPEFHVDYCFPGDDMGFKLSILVGVERDTGAKVSVVVPQKGTTGKYASGEVVSFMDNQGCTFKDVVVKSDQENAIKYVVDDVCMARTGAKTLKMNAPTKVKGSNGVIERAVQSVEGQLRTMKDALDLRYKQIIPAEHCIVTWLVKYVSVLLNKMEIGHDGKTAEPRTRGRKSAILGLEFGEKPLFKRKIETNYLEKIS